MEPDQASIDRACVVKIREHGWWQGAVIDAAELSACVGELPAGPSHWIMASQTCNLFNPSLDKVRVVEWIGAAELLAGDVNAVAATGSLPRNIHCCATSEDGTEILHLDCDIQYRLWTERRCLIDLMPLGVRLRDRGRANHEKQKDGFIGWIARSYTRLELSDELNKALDDGKVTDLLKNFIRSQKDNLYGIFMDIEDGAGADPTTANPTFENMCMVEVYFVVNNADVLDPLNELLSKAMDAEVGNSKWTEGSRLPKLVGRRVRAAQFGLNISVLARLWTEFSAEEISRMIRYTLGDHFSDSGVAA